MRDDGTPGSSTRSFTLKPVPPFRLDGTVWALRRRPGNAIDRRDGVAWRRVHDLARGICEVRVTQTGPPENPNLRILASGRALTADAKSPMRNLLTRMLGLDMDLSGFYHLTRHNRTMASLAERFRGVRLPRFPTLFEAPVNAIACQQISLTVGIILLNRLDRTVLVSVHLTGPPSVFPGRRSWPAVHLLLSGLADEGYPDPFHPLFSEGEVRFFAGHMMPIPDSIHPGNTHNTREVPCRTDTVPG